MTLDADPELHRRLKLATAEEHRLIERALPVMSESFQFSDYVEILKRHFAFYKAYEALILTSTHTLGDGLQIFRRCKLPWLESDLAACSFVPELVPRTVSENDLPPLQTEAQILGALYVTEGSTLGGTLISNHLLKKFNRTDLPIAFFKGYGAETGKMWRSFLNHMASHIGPDQFEATAHSAVETFKVLNVVLSGGVPHAP